MKQLNYDGDGFYITYSDSKAVDRLSLEDLPEDIDIGTKVHFDKDNIIIVIRCPLTRYELWEECCSKYHKSLNDLLTSEEIKALEEAPLRRTIGPIEI